MVPSRVVRTAGLAIGAAALVFALLPFSAPIGGPRLLIQPAYASCGPAVIEATRTPPKDTGWFGYAPLTSTPVGFTTRPCYAPARHRLIVSAIGLMLAVLLGWLSSRIDGGPGWFRRVRWRPKPA